jgi:hypothetical protein
MARALVMLDQDLTRWPTGDGRLRMDTDGEHAIPMIPKRRCPGGRIPAAGSTGKKNAPAKGTGAPMKRRTARLGRQ